MGNNQVAKRDRTLSTFDTSKVPDAIGAIIHVEGWAHAIVSGTPYREPNPDFISQMLAYQTITATSQEEVFEQANIRGLQKIIPNVPEATMGNIEITDLYVAESDYETGNPCFVIVSYISLDTGEEGKFTTGATNVQATILGLLVNGLWPIRCKIKRGESKDKGGRYLLFVLPAD
jgi:hypothetical protein